MNIRQAFAAVSFALSLASVLADEALETWMETVTEQIEKRSLADIQSKTDWEQHRQTYRGQLADMLGLKPLPPRTDLHPTITGRLEHEEFTVEKLHFQPSPKLYVAGNLYVPRKRERLLPAILYVCGHGRAVIDGVSYGNKVHYQHHGAWFARNGYVCLIIDTVQLGEFPGMHHGTYRHHLWWWANRGYTPAGAEAWTGIRAIDYLQSRPEVDPERIGVTGRSGGGAYSWWIAALDERVACAVPVAGITSLRNHIVDGCIEGHCDCMYMVNHHGWDFDQVAALVAPRPLLISNTDKDPIFPLDGVVHVYNGTRRIYNLLDAEDRIGLHITAGGHKDTQELRIHAFRWFNRWLKNDDSPVTIPAEALFDKRELKVFDTLPEDEITTTVHEHLVQQAQATAPATPAEWETWASGVLPELIKILHSKSPPSPLFIDQELFARKSGVLALLPRMELAPIKQLPNLTHIRRRHHLLGRSIDAEHAIALNRELSRESSGKPMVVSARGEECKTLLLTALFTSEVKEIELHELPASFAGPDPNEEEAVFLGINRHLTLPQLVALVAEQKNVRIADSPDFDPTLSLTIIKMLGKEGNLIISNP